MHITDANLRADPDREIHVRLLGTGGPELTLDRQGPSTLIEAGGQQLLFDLGRGLMQRAYECGVSIRTVARVFLTHLHSDHLCDMADFWMTGWFMLHRPTAIEVWGPAGTAEYVRYMQKAHAHDLRVRHSKIPAGREFHVTEIEEGLVYDRDGLRVTAFAVDHVDVKLAMGYRIDYAGRSVVLSGDTTYCPNLIKYSQNADLLIHEVAAASDALYASNEPTRNVIRNHTTPEQAAEVFKRSTPRLAVFNHVVRLGVTDYDIMERARALYPGRLEMGLDRMEIIVGDSIRIVPPGLPKVFADLIQRDDASARDNR